jgi:hypothetical protein
MVFDAHDRAFAFFWTKYARRILAIVSTTSIPISAPDRPSGAMWTHTPRGSLLG